MKQSEYKELYNQFKSASQKSYDLATSNVSEEIAEHLVQKKIYNQIKAQLEALPHVKVSFSIGSRSYYQSVIKLGNSYFQHGRKMTASRGYYCITEIAEITKGMKSEMLSDSYYY